MSRCRRTDSILDIVADPERGVDALTDEHWQHVGICAECTTAVRGMQRLDGALSAALRSTPHEPLPPTVLATPAVPRRADPPRVAPMLAVAAVVVLAVAVSAFTLEWIDVRGIGVAPSSSATPSILPSASPTATPEATPQPSTSPSPTPPPSDTVSPGVLGLAVGQVAAVVDEPLVVRTAPGTDPDSTITEDRLWIGQRVRVLDGPADVDGYTWWEVQVGEIRGWVADAEADDSAPWLAPLLDAEIHFWRHAGESVGLAPELFSVLPDGSDERRIGDPRAAAMQLALSCGFGTGPLSWTADGRRATFELSPGGCASDIWVMDPDTEAFRNLGEGRQPAWRPDGGAIVFAPNVPYMAAPTPGTGELRVAAKDTFEPTILDDTGGSMFSGSPAWSPDRGSLVFDGSTPGPDDLAEWDYGIYLANADGTEVRRLADGQLPRWSPDGRWIAFVVSDGDGTLTMWRIRPDGRDATELGEGFNPTFSPDGTQMAFVRDDSLWLSAPDGSEATPVLPSTGIDGFAWAPSGVALVAAAHATDGESTDLFVVSLQGDEPAITHVVDKAHAPSWRPIVFLGVAD